MFDLNSPIAVCSVCKRPPDTWRCREHFVDEILKLTAERDALKAKLRAANIIDIEIAAKMAENFGTQMRGVVDENLLGKVGETAETVLKRFAARLRGGFR